MMPPAPNAKSGLLKERMEQMDGVLALNKPTGLSSAACVGLIKRRLGQSKIGHAGTLDPMAAGVLIILLGQATKIAGLLLENGEKIYSGTIRFGLSTDTWDAQGRILEEAPPELTAQVTLERLREAMQSFLGEQEQEVPPFSAAKHQGRPLYALARDGKPTPVKRKTVQISRADLEWFKTPLARFRVACGSGTYIRSLAHSLGKRFACGATLMELTREYSHPFGLDATVTLRELLDEPGLLAQKTVSLQKALPGLPALALEEDLCRRVKNGHSLVISVLPPVRGDKALFLDKQGCPLALALKRQKGDATLWTIGRGLWNT